MRFTTLSFLAFALVPFTQLGCSSSPKEAPPSAEAAASTKPLTQTPGLDTCVLIYSLADETWVEEFNPERCKQRNPACSTFKVPLAVMAFDSGTLKDEHALMKWDKKPRMLDAWNKDHTAASWMKESVVWYSQRITTKMGRAKVQDYLTRFDYGNKDFSGGLIDAWLTPTPTSKEPIKSTVLISAYEQVEFMKKLWTNKLPVSARSMDLTKQIMYLETSPAGVKLHGKTGSGYVGPDANQRLGWFIGYVEKGGKGYVGVATFNDVRRATSTEFGGPQAKQIFKDALATKGLF